MKNLKILADMCLEVNNLLDQLYKKGIITKETYEEHTRLKLHFLKNWDRLSLEDESG